jgi:hypothetical protein
MASAGASRSAACPARASSDRGGAMTASETVGGHENLSIVQYLTLARSPQAERQTGALLDPHRGPALHTDAREGSPSSPLTCEAPRRRPGSSRSITTRSTARLQQEPLGERPRRPCVSRPSRAPRSCGHFRWRLTRTQRHGTAAPSGGGRALRGPLGVSHAKPAETPGRAVGPVECQSRRSAAALPPHGTRSTRSRTLTGSAVCCQRIASPPAPSPRPAGIAPLFCVS